MLTAGPRATLGLLSPGDRPIERGDRFTTAFGIWGALNCRAGFVVEDAAELPDGIRDYVERARRAVLRGGRRVVRGAARRPDRRRAPGDHRPPPRRPVLRHLPQPGPPDPLDEWVNSPISPGSTIELRSGMAFQVDVIPATGTPYFTTNIEDGIALADASLREAFATRLSGRLGADPGAAGVHGRRRSGSSSTRTCCRSRTSRPGCRRSCSGPGGR